MSNTIEYKNHLQFCPECGTPLYLTDKDCPGCGINLVGHNEQKNRWDAILQSKREMKELERQKYKAQQEKEKAQRLQWSKEVDARNKYKKRKKIATIILAIFVFLMLVALNP